MAVDFRILDTNKVIAATLSVSSEDSAFPKENLQLYSRSKVWRPSGNFLIDSTNNKLNFDEGGGELTATISSAAYTSATLATEIKTQLDAAGAETYTVSYSDSTKKFTILHANGGGTLSLLWKTGTNGADGTDTHIGTAIGFSDAADDTGATPTTGYTGDNVALHTEEWLVVDMGSAVAVDSVALLFNPIDGLTLSTGAVIKIQANASDSWGSPSVDTTLTLDQQDKVATHFYATDQTFRYWRLYIQDAQNAQLYIEVPKLVLANATVLTQNPEQTFSYSLKDQSERKRTDYGHQYSDQRPNLRAMDFTYKYLDYADLETLLDIYNVIQGNIPICVALDTQEDLFDKDRFFIYGVMGLSFAVKSVTRDLTDTGFGIEEVI